MPLTLIFKQHDLHPVQREGLSEAVRHRVLLFLEDLSYLESHREIILRVGLMRGGERRGEEKRDKRGGDERKRRKKKMRGEG